MGMIMYKRVPGNADYEITHEGKIRRCNGKPSKLTIIDNKVTITLFRAKQVVDVRWLGLMAHFEVKLNDSTMRHFYTITFADMAEQPTRPYAGKWMVFERPIIIAKKYRLVPGYTDLAVSKEGVVYDVFKRKVIEQYHQTNGYMAFDFYDPDKSSNNSVRVHRLVALAWHPRTEYLTNPYVNHKNGNKGDPRHSNLEWCSNAENIKHSIDQGLRLDADRVKVKDHLTGLVTEYASRSRAAEAMGIAYSKVCNAKRGEVRTSLIDNRWEIKLINDESDWLVDPIDKVKGYHLDIYIDKDMYTVDRVSKLVSLVREKCGPLKGQYKLPDTIASANSLEAIEWMIDYSYPNRVRVVVKRRPTLLNGPYLAKHLETGQIIKHKSFKGLAKLVNVHWLKIRNVIRNKDPYQYDGWAFKQDDGSEWLDDYIVNPGSAMKIKATKIDDGSTFILSSLREAARHFDTLRTVIKVRIKHRRPLLGHLLEYTS